LWRYWLRRVRWSLRGGVAKRPYSAHICVGRERA
jgi:hypothetical protein